MSMGFRIAKRVQNTTLQRRVRPRQDDGPSSYSFNTHQVSEVHTRGKQLEENSKVDERIRTSLAGLHKDTRDLLTGGISYGNDDAQDDAGGNDVRMEFDPSAWEDVPEDVEEGEVFWHAIRAASVLQWRNRGRRYRCERSWKTRRDQHFKSWEQVHVNVVDTYLAWKRSSPADASSNTPPSPPSDPRSNLSSDPPLGVPYTIQIYDIFTLEDKYTVYRPHTSTSPAIDFAHHGYLVKTPIEPTVGVSFRTLNLFHRIRLRKPSFSVEAFTKVVCDHYGVGM
ncbi:hypothetical protein QCA50_001287 [Cerrena zonata]|uniref:Uncharacterized protein n=1 Tax=Cerrena zonata TaxID=2478898 RepID=A0AAW0GWH4_9APHY